MLLSYGPQALRHCLLLQATPCVTQKMLALIVLVHRADEFALT